MLKQLCVTQYGRSHVPSGEREAIEHIGISKADETVGLPMHSRSKFKMLKPAGHIFGGKGALEGLISAASNTGLHGRGLLGVFYN